MKQLANDQVTPAETAELLRLAEASLALQGDFVELGCYRGDTSILLGKLLQHHSSSSANSPLSPPKHLWLYDSFAGLPAKSPEDASGVGANFQSGELAVTKRAVVDKLRKHGLNLSAAPQPTSSTVIVKKAWFSDIQPSDLPSEIAFAFLDGDLYDSIRVSLELVAPRLSKQGIMIVHDYNNPALPGSSHAVDQWLRSHLNFRLEVRHTLAILREVC